MDCEYIYRCFVCEKRETIYNLYKEQLNMVVFVRAKGMSIHEAYAYNFSEKSPSKHSCSVYIAAQRYNFITVISLFTRSPVPPFPCSSP